MSNQIEKEIEALRSRLAELEQAKAREARLKATLEQAHQQLTDTLQQGEVTLEEFVRCYQKDFRKIVAKIEREQVGRKGKAAQKPATPAPTKKKAVRKKAAKTKRGPKVTVKVPAGRYSNIPPDTQRIFEVKEKGKRPKDVTTYAEELGLSAFMQQCFIGEL